MAEVPPGYSRATRRRSAASRHIGFNLVTGWSVRLISGPARGEDIDLWDTEVNSSGELAKASPLF